jgi:hypothetical protein
MRLLECGWATVLGTLRPLRLGRAVVLVLIAGIPSVAQQTDETSAATTGVVSAGQQPDGDDCAKINASWGALPSTGGTVDARQFTGTQACASNPFDGVIKAGNTLLGGTTYQTSRTWVVPGKSVLQGIGRGDSQANNSVIQAASNLLGPVLQLSSGSEAIEGVRAESLTVDCNNDDNVTGVLDNVAQEESGLQHVLIVNCTNIGLDIEDGSQNASFDDIEVLSGGASPSTRPVVVNTTGPLRGIHGITVNTWSLPYPDVAMHIGSMGSYTDMHCEGAVTCFYVTADNVTLMNVECGPNVRVCVEIAPNVRNVTITGVLNTSSGGVIIEDLASRVTLTATGESSGVGWYSIGNGTPAPVCSSSVHVVCTFKMPAVQERMRFPIVR